MFWEKQLGTLYIRIRPERVSEYVFGQAFIYSGKPVFEGLVLAFHAWNGLDSYRGTCPVIIFNLIRQEICVTCVLDWNKGRQGGSVDCSVAERRVDCTVHVHKNTIFHRYVSVMILYPGTLAALNKA